MADKWLDPDQEPIHLKIKTSEEGYHFNNFMYSLV